MAIIPAIDLFPQQSLPRSVCTSHSCVMLYRFDVQLPNSASGLMFCLEFWSFKYLGHLEHRFQANFTTFEHNLWICIYDQCTSGIIINMTLAEKILTLQGELYTGIFLDSSVATGLQCFISASNVTLVNWEKIDQHLNVNISIFSCQSCIHFHFLPALQACKFEIHIPTLKIYMPQTVRTGAYLFSPCEWVGPWWPLLLCLACSFGI